MASRTNAPFDLAEAPPTRISLLALGRDDHVLCIVMHHIITDGWSDVVLMDDLYACYLARAAGRVPDLPALPVQYGDIALWQRERYSGPVAEEALAYWRRRLAHPQWLELSFADTPGVQGREGAYCTFEVPEEVTAALERLAQQHGASLFMVLVAAYQILLSRHSGQTDILISTTWSARDRVEMEPVIGYLTDPMVLRGDLSGDPAFTDLLDGTRRTVLEAHAHRLVPFERLLTSLGVTREVHFRNPLLSTTLILHSQAGDGRPPERLGDLSVEWFDDGYLQAQFTLGMQVWRTHHGMRVVLSYDVARFRAATIESLAARAAVLLRGIADAPGTRISRLPMLTGADVAALSTDHAPGQDRQETVPAAFARAAAAFPAATALVCGDEPVSYAELDARVARLAAELRRRGAVTGGVVGVCLGRSADAVVALLAVWRAGAAYLPLDPEYPDSRLAFLIADSGARLVVTDGALAGRLPSGTGLVTAGVTAAAEHGEQGGGRWPEPGDPAYLIYTSGSTGQAKGVLVEHGALAGRVRWMRQEYGLRPGDRVVQFASLSFDTHAEELYPALTAGSSVLLLPDGAITLPDVLRGQAGREVTVLDLPTAYWHQLTQALDDVAWPEPLRLVIIGGEQAHAAAVARWRARFGDRVRLVNTYGPTEATIVATACELGAADTTGHPPIGRPVGGTWPTPSAGPASTSASPAGSSPPSSRWACSGPGVAVAGRCLSPPPTARPPGRGGGSCSGSAWSACRPTWSTRGPARSPALSSPPWAARRCWSAWSPAPARPRRWGSGCSPARRRPLGPLLELDGDRLRHDRRVRPADGVGAAWGRRASPWPRRWCSWSAPARPCAPPPSRCCSRSPPGRRPRPRLRGAQGAGPDRGVAGPLLVAGVIALTAQIWPGLLDPRGSRCGGDGCWPGCTGRCATRAPDRPRTSSRRGCRGPSTSHPGLLADHVRADDLRGDLLPLGRRPPGHRGGGARRLRGRDGRRGGGLARHRLRLRPGRPAPCWCCRWWSVRAVPGVRRPCRGRVVGILLWGLATGIHDSTVKALVAELVPGRRLGTAYGAFAAYQALAALAGGLLAGWLYGAHRTWLVGVIVVAQVVALVLLAAVLAGTATGPQGLADPRLG